VAHHTRFLLAAGYVTHLKYHLEQIIPGKSVVDTNRITALLKLSTFLLHKKHRFQYGNGQYAG
jgi:hypothetical protein